MKIIAKNVGEVYLIHTGKVDGKDQGIVADLDDGVRHPEFYIQSIIARGYWEAFEHDEKLLKKLMKLPLAKNPKPERASRFIGVPEEFEYLGTIDEIKVIRDE